jgi:anti-sigma regulatory factor (Ser/Thr protein kinase)
MDTWLSEVTYSGRPESVGDARRFVGTSLVEAGLQRILDDARLVTSELASNVVRHARTGFTVTLVVVEGSLLLSVRDWAAPYPVTGTTDRLAERGRGLMLVEALSESWGVTPADGGGKSVWARLLADP